jgi:hypothetical protein
MSRLSQALKIMVGILCYSVEVRTYPMQLRLLLAAAVAVVVVTAAPVLLDITASQPTLALIDQTYTDAVVIRVAAGVALPTVAINRCVFSATLQIVSATGRVDPDSSASVSISSSMFTGLSSITIENLKSSGAARGITLRNTTVQDTKYGTSITLRNITMTAGAGIEIVKLVIARGTPQFSPGQVSEGIRIESCSFVGQGSRLVVSSSTVSLAAYHPAGWIPVTLRAVYVDASTVFNDGANFTLGPDLTLSVDTAPQVNHLVCLEDRSVTAPRLVADATIMFAGINVTQGGLMQLAYVDASRGNVVVENVVGASVITLSDIRSMSAESGDLVLRSSTIVDQLVLANIVLTRRTLSFDLVKLTAGDFIASNVTISSGAWTIRSLSIAAVYYGAAATFRNITLVDSPLSITDSRIGRESTIYTRWLAVTGIMFEACTFTGSVAGLSIASSSINALAPAAPGGWPSTPSSGILLPGPTMFTNGAKLQLGPALTITLTGDVEVRVAVDMIANRELTGIPAVKDGFFRLEQLTLPVMGILRLGFIHAPREPIVVAAVKSATSMYITNVTLESRTASMKCRDVETRSDVVFEAFVMRSGAGLVIERLNVTQGSLAFLEVDSSGAGGGVVLDESSVAHIDYSVGVTFSQMKLADAGLDITRTVIVRDVADWRHLRRSSGIDLLGLTLSGLSSRINITQTTIRVRNPNTPGGWTPNDNHGIYLDDATAIEDGTVALGPTLTLNLFGDTDAVKYALHANNRKVGQLLLTNANFTMVDVAMPNGGAIRLGRVEQPRSDLLFADITTASSVQLHNVNSSDGVHVLFSNVTTLYGFEVKNVTVASSSQLIVSRARTLNGLLSIDGFQSSSSASGMFIRNCSIRYSTGYATAILLSRSLITRGSLELVNVTVEIVLGAWANGARAQGLSFEAFMCTSCVATVMNSQIALIGRSSPGGGWQVATMTAVTFDSRTSFIDSTLRIGPDVSIKFAQGTDEVKEAIVVARSGRAAPFVVNGTLAVVDVRMSVGGVLRLNDVIEPRDDVILQKIETATSLTLSNFRITHERKLIIDRCSLREGLAISTVDLSSNVAMSLSNINVSDGTVTLNDVNASASNMTLTNVTVRALGYGTVALFRGLRFSDNSNMVIHNVSLASTEASYAAQGSLTGVQLDASTFDASTATISALTIRLQGPGTPSGWPINWLSAVHFDSTTTFRNGARLTIGPQVTLTLIQPDNIHDAISVADRVGNTSFMVDSTLTVRDVNITSLGAIRLNNVIEPPDDVILQKIETATSLTLSNFRIKRERKLIIDRCSLRGGLVMSSIDLSRNVAMSLSNINVSGGTVTLNDVNASASDMTLTNVTVRALGYGAVALFRGLRFSDNSNMGIHNLSLASTEASYAAQGSLTGVQLDASTFDASTATISALTIRLQGPGTPSGWPINWLSAVHFDSTTTFRNGARLTIGPQVTLTLIQPDNIHDAISVADRVGNASFMVDSSLTVRDVNITSLGAVRLGYLLVPRSPIVIDNVAVCTGFYLVNSVIRDCTITRLAITKDLKVSNVELLDEARLAMSSVQITAGQGEFSRLIIGRGSSVSLQGSSIANVGYGDALAVRHTIAYRGSRIDIARVNFQRFAHVSAYKVDDVTGFKLDNVTFLDASCYVNTMTVNASVPGTPSGWPPSVAAGISIEPTTSFQGRSARLEIGPRIIATVQADQGYDAIIAMSTRTMPFLVNSSLRIVDVFAPSSGFLRISDLLLTRQRVDITNVRGIRDLQIFDAILDTSIIVLRAITVSATITLRRFVGTNASIIAIASSVAVGADVAVESATLTNGTQLQFLNMQAASLTIKDSTIASSSQVFLVNSSMFALGSGTSLQLISSFVRDSCSGITVSNSSLTSKLGRSVNVDPTTQFLGGSHFIVRAGCELASLEGPANFHAGPGAARRSALIIDESIRFAGPGSIAVEGFLELRAGSMIRIHDARANSVSISTTSTSSAGQLLIDVRGSAFSEFAMKAVQFMNSTVVIADSQVGSLRLRTAAFSAASRVRFSNIAASQASDLTAIALDDGSRLVIANASFSAGSGTGALSLSQWSVVRNAAAAAVIFANVRFTGQKMSPADPNVAFSGAAGAVPLLQWCVVDATTSGLGDGGLFSKFSIDDASTVTCGPDICGSGDTVAKAAEILGCACSTAVSVTSDDITRCDETASQDLVMVRAQQAQAARAAENCADMLPIPLEAAPPSITPSSTITASFVGTESHTEGSSTRTPRNPHHSATITFVAPQDTGRTSTRTIRHPPTPPPPTISMSREQPAGPHTSTTTLSREHARMSVSSSTGPSEAPVLIAAAAPMLTSAEAGAVNAMATTSVALTAALGAGGGGASADGIQSLLSVGFATCAPGGVRSASSAASAALAPFTVTFAGASATIIGSLLAATAFAIIHVVIVVILALWRGAGLSAESFWRSCDSVMFPTISVQVANSLAQGVSLDAFRIVGSTIVKPFDGCCPTNVTAADIAVAAASLLLIIGLLVKALAWLIYAAPSLCDFVPYEHAFAERSTMSRGMIFPSGFWICRDTARRLRFLIGAARGSPRRCFGIAARGQGVIIALLACPLVAAASCDLQMALIAAQFVAMAAAVIVLRPYRVAWANWLRPFQQLLAAAVCLEFFFSSALKGVTPRIVLISAGVSFLESVASVATVITERRRWKKAELAARASVAAAKAATVPLSTSMVSTTSTQAAFASNATIAIAKDSVGNASLATPLLKVPIMEASSFASAVPDRAPSRNPLAATSTNSTFRNAI